MVVPCLDDESDVVRGEAALALGRLGFRAAVPKLLSRLAALPRWSNARWWICQTLGALGDTNAIDPLLSIASDPTERDLHAFAATALGKLGDRRALEVLQSLQESRDEDVRKAAREAVTALEGGAAELQGDCDYRNAHLVEGVPTGSSGDAVLRRFTKAHRLHFAELIPFCAVGFAWDGDMATWDHVWSRKGPITPKSASARAGSRPMARGAIRTRPHPGSSGPLRPPYAPQRRPPRRQALRDALPARSGTRATVPCIARWSAPA